MRGERGEKKKNTIREDGMKGEEIGQEMTEDVARGHGELRQDKRLEMKEKRSDTRRGYEKIYDKTGGDLKGNKRRSDKVGGEQMKWKK